MHHPHPHPPRQSGSKHGSEGAFAVHLLPLYSSTPRSSLRIFSARRQMTAEFDAAGIVRRNNKNRIFDASTKKRTMW